MSAHAMPSRELQAAMDRPLYTCMFTLPGGKLYKVCGDLCMYGPSVGYFERRGWPK